MVLYALNAALFITQTKIRYNRNPLENEDPSKTKIPKTPSKLYPWEERWSIAQCFLGSCIDRFKSTAWSIKFSKKKFQWNINKIFILPWAKHPRKSYRSRHNKSCQGLTKIKTLENEARRPKPKTHSKKKRSREKDANMWFPLSCQCSHPIMSSIVHKMHCWKSCLVLWFLSVSNSSFRDTTDYAIPSAYFVFFFWVFVIYPTLSWLRK